MFFEIRQLDNRLCQGLLAAIVPQSVEADVAKYLAHPKWESRMLLQILKLIERLQECVLQSILCRLFGTHVPQCPQIEAILMA